MITLICPSRGRPEKMKRMWQSALKTAHNPQQLRLVAGIEEEQKRLYQTEMAGMDFLITLHPDYGVVQIINSIIAGLHSDTRLFMVAPDDVIFTTPHWDKAVIDHYNALECKAHVYCLRDSRDVTGTPHPILTREYINLMGYFYPPIFLHWFVDSWTASLAKNAHIFTHLKDYELMHDKPSDKGEYDDTHLRVRQRGWLERDRYVNATCHHFLGTEKERLVRTIQHMMGTREHLD